MTDAQGCLTDLIAAELSDLIALRHDLHAHPQVAFEEQYASDAVQKELRRLGIPHVAGIGKTGVIGWIKPANPAAANLPAVALRADMDALPIQEATGLPYASQNPGVMHACGHDGHTTMLLGTARVLMRLRDRLPCPVKLLFQPAEEKGGGAKHIIDAGALDERTGGCKVNRVLGLHGWATLDLGKMSTRPGVMMAATDLFSITIRGKGGHGAAPHLTRDPIVAAAHVVVALQTVVSRSVNPVDPAVLTVGVIQGGQTENVIPETVTLRGTIRSVETRVASLIHQRLQEIAQATAQAFGCSAEVSMYEGYPPVVNEASLAAQTIQTLSQELGAENLQPMNTPVMGAEDFAYYGQLVPSCFIYLGLRPPGHEAYPAVHNPYFDFNDAAMPMGIRALCALALG